MTIFLRNNFSRNVHSLFLKRKYIFGMLTAKLNHFSEMPIREFKGELDRYNGIHIDSTQEICNIETFPQRLQFSLDKWTRAQRKGVWFKIAIGHSNWVPILANNGFQFHHAKNNYVMMYKWLPNTECLIPTFAHTMFAVGALILNDKSQILIIKDKYFLAGHWKFPGGIIEPGESLISAAEREVKEETNITFKFTSLVCFMHAPKGNFGCSDFYVLVAGRALTSDIKICPEEVEDCMWIDINEYLTRDDVTPFNKEVLHHYLKYQKNKLAIGFSEGIHKVSRRPYMLYSVNINED